MIARLLAKVLARPRVVDWLIQRAKKTPYTHIMSEDGSVVYMERYWLFNPYPADTSGSERRGWQFPISMRLHRIVREDLDRHLHDHPWNARTIILRGWYYENRLQPDGLTRGVFRTEGQTATLKFGEYHRITQVSQGGVWTLFITGPYRGTWGFMVDGVKVPWRKYLNIE